MQLRAVCFFSAKRLCACYLLILTDYLPDHKSKMPLLVVHFPPCFLSSGGRIPLNGDACCVLTSLKARSDRVADLWCLRDFMVLCLLFSIEGKDGDHEEAVGPGEAK